MNKLAKDILKTESSNPKDGLLVPLVINYFLEKGKRAQYTDEEGIDIVLNVLRQQNDRIDTRGKRKSFSGGSSSNCMRQQAIDIKLGDVGVKEPDYRLVNIFEDGFWRNLRWLVVFHRMGILKQYEKTKYDPVFNMSWTPDCILDLSEYYGKEYKYVPVEIKGMHTGEFDSFTARTGLSKWAASRTMQMHSYMLAENVSHWLLWAENKNSQEFGEYWMPRDKNIIQYLTKRYRYMKKAAANNSLPAIECEMQSSDKKYATCHRNKRCAQFALENYPSLKGMKDRVLMETKSKRAFV